MDVRDGLEFVVYTKASGFRRSLVATGGSSVELVANGIGTAELTIDDDHPALPDLTVQGARVAVRFRGEEHFRGRVEELAGVGPDGATTFQVAGDLRKLWHWEGWQVPSATLTATPKTMPSGYAVYTGPSETVFKNALAANFTRLGVPWTVAATQGRGKPARAEFRMHPLADKLVPLLSRDGLVITLAYSGASVIVDVKAGKTIPGVLTVDSGVTDSYGFKMAAPTATRAVVGGRGEGVAREFVQVIDSAREADWADIIEAFVDGRNTDVGADLSIDAQEALDEGAPLAGITLDLIETDRFQFGTTFDVGDFIAVRVGPVDLTEQITSVSITDDPDEGVVVTPHLGGGDTEDDPDVKTAQQVAALARGQRDAGRR